MRYLLTFLGMISLLLPAPAVQADPFSMPTPPLPLAQDGRLGKLEPGSRAEVAAWQARGATWPVEGLWCGLGTNYDQQVLFAGATINFPIWSGQPVDAMNQAALYEPRRPDISGTKVVYVDHRPRGSPGDYNDSDFGRSDLRMFDLDPGLLGIPGGTSPGPGIRGTPEPIHPTGGPDDFPMIMGSGLVWQAQSFEPNPPVEDIWDVFFINLSTNRTGERFMTEAVSLTKKSGEEATRPSIWVTGRENKFDDKCRFLAAYQTSANNAIVAHALAPNGDILFTHDIVPDHEGHIYQQPAVSERGIAFQFYDKANDFYGIGYNDWNDTYLIKPEDFGSGCKSLVQPRIGGEDGRYVVFLGLECNVINNHPLSVLYVNDLGNPEEEGDTRASYSFPLPLLGISPTDQVAAAPRYDISGSLIVLVNDDDQVIHLDMEHQ